MDLNSTKYQDVDLEIRIVLGNFEEKLHGLWFPYGCYVME